MKVLIRDKATGKVYSIDEGNAVSTFGVTQDSINQAKEAAKIGQSGLTPSEYNETFQVPKLSATDQQAQDLMNLINSAISGGRTLGDISSEYNPKINAIPGQEEKLQTSLLSSYNAKHNLAEKQAGGWGQYTESSEQLEGMGFNPKVAQTAKPSIPTLKGSQATSVNLLKNILSSAQAAQSSWKPEYSGLLNSTLGTGRIALNMPGAREEQQFRQRLGDIRTAIRAAISGAAISPYEAKEIEALLPKITQSDTQVMSQLEGLLGMSKSKVGNILSTAGITTPVDEYLGQGTPQTQPTQKIRMTDPNGNLFELDASEAEEARKHGWR